MIRRVLAILALCIGIAHAQTTETIPATPSSVLKWYAYGGSGVPAGVIPATQQTDKAAVFAAAKAAVESTYPGYTCEGGPPADPAAGQSISALVGSCSKPYSSFKEIGMWGGWQSGYTCPDSTWTLSGTTCTRTACRADQIRDASGNCTCRPGQVTDQYGVCGCPGIQELVNGACGCDPASSGRYKGIPIGGTGSDIPNTTCMDGCTVTVGGVGVAMGGQWAASLGKITGATCTPGGADELKKKTPAQDNRTPEQKCLGQGQGYVTTSNGTTCVSPGDAPEPLKTKSKEEQNKTVPGNPGASTSTEKITECVGSQCTTTETTKDGNGNVIGTGTRSGTGKGGDGDGETDCDKYPDSVGCAKFGTPDAGDNLQEKAAGVSSITPVSVGGSATCPAPLQLPKGMTFSFTPYCDFASGLRPIIIALAWLSAGFLIFGFRQT